MSDWAEDWTIPEGLHPEIKDYRFDLEEALSAVVSLTAHVPDDAFTAQTLGTERAGTGVAIREDGLVLTIGYLITEANEVWLKTRSGRVVAAHVLGYDQATGFGLVKALSRLDIPTLALGDSRDVDLGDRVILAGAGGRARAVAARLMARQEFAGYWEYLLDDALFTAPAHPHWGGTALIGKTGDLIGIGSLQVHHRLPNGAVAPINMSVPIELLPPVLDDIITLGRPNRPPRPWLGLFAAESDGHIVVAGLAGNGPAKRAGLKEGDTILKVGPDKVRDLPQFFRKLWKLGKAGVEVPLTLDREGDVFDMRITSADRHRFLKGMKLH